MIKNLSCYVLFSSVTIFLFGCVSRTEKLPVRVEQIKLDTDPVKIKLPPIPIIPSLPVHSTEMNGQNWSSKFLSKELTHYEWNDGIQLIVDKLLQVHGIISGSVLLVDSVNNRTNGSFNTWRVTEKIRNMLEKNGNFTIVSLKKLHLAKEHLGLSPQDTLSSSSKSIGIARNVGAHYVLYSNAIGNINSPFLQIQLMLVQTGEIIWSEKAPFVPL